MDFTGPQVYRGLAGFFLIQDDEETRPASGGDRELPPMICDRSFEADGSLRYPALDPSLMLRHGVERAFAGEASRDAVVPVNGCRGRTQEVAAVRYRLRLLNASNARRYALALRPGGSFTQVGSDQAC